METKVMIDTRVVSYMKVNGRISATRTIFKGSYEECLKFYIENKAKYRQEDRYLELMTL